MSSLSEPAPGRLPTVEIFPPIDYRHRLHLARCEPAAFFGPWHPGDDVLPERARWIHESPERHALILPESEPIVAEVAECFRDWGVIPPETKVDPAAPWESLGILLEPDLILLRASDSEPRMVAACVCFPSSWEPERKLGLGLPAIHDVVPGLNDDLGTTIAGFLSRLRPGVAWLRANWGLSASPERNQHPHRRLPRLTPEVATDDVWIRIEHQALVALPRTRGILFGIRIEQQSLRHFAAQPSLALALSRALQTMPEAMAQYKGLARIRHRLAADLHSLPRSDPSV